MDQSARSMTTASRREVPGEEDAIVEHDGHEHVDGERNRRQHLVGGRVDHRRRGIGGQARIVVVDPGDDQVVPRLHVVTVDVEVDRRRCVPGWSGRSGGADARRTPTSSRRRRSCGWSPDRRRPSAAWRRSCSCSDRCGRTRRPVRTHMRPSAGCDLERAVADVDPGEDVAGVGVDPHHRAAVELAEPDGSEADARSVRDSASNGTLSAAAAARSASTGPHDAPMMAYLTAMPPRASRYRSMFSAATAPSPAAAAASLSSSAASAATTSSTISSICGRSAAGTAMSSTFIAPSASARSMASCASTVSTVPSLGGRFARTAPGGAEARRRRAGIPPS